MANISTLGQSLDQISRLKTQQLTLDNLSTQLATGKKTQVFQGLGSDTIQSARARADINSIDTYIGNITNADRRISLMLNAIEEIQAQAKNIQDGIVVSVQQGDLPDLEVIKDLAANVQDFIVNLMNSKDGDRFIFAGADSGTRPVEDTGLFESFLGEFIPDSSDLTNPPLVASGVIGQWGDGTIDTDTFIQTYRATSETVLGYSSALTNDTAGDVFVRVDDDSELKYTALADTKGMKDILIAVGVIAELPPVEFAPGALNDPTATTIAGDQPPFPPEEKQDNFYQVFNDLSTLIGQAVDLLDQERFKLSQTQANIQKIEISHEQDKNRFANIIDEVENVDITEVASKINQIQIQLEASFSVTAVLSQLTLARFI